MKTKILILFTIIAFSATVSYSQNILLSESAKVLEAKLKTGDSEAILESVKSGDTSLIPYLEYLSKNGNYKAQVGLVKLGDENALRQIISEIDTNNPSYLAGMNKLFLVGGKPAFKKFYTLLDDSTQVEIDEICPTATPFCNDVFYPPKNVMATYYLSQMVDNPPTRRKLPSNRIDIWKKWFENHKELIE